MLRRDDAAPGPGGDVQQVRQEALPSRYRGNERRVQIIIINEYKKSL